MGFFDAIPVLNDVEDAAGTVGTGAVDSLIADPGNALLGVNADNMGIFEENAAGAKTMNLATLGLGGEGGLVSDVLMPGQGAPGETTTSDGLPTYGDRTTPPEEQGTSGLLLAGGGAIVAALAMAVVMN